MSTSNQNNNEEYHNQIREQKKVLRKKIRTLMKHMSNEKIQQQSLEVWDRLYELASYKNAKSVGLFLSMPQGEINTDPVLKRVLSDGKKLYVPRVGLDFEKCDMDLILVSTDTTSVETDKSDEENDTLFYQKWSKNKWGIPEPPVDDNNPKETSAGPGDIDILIVPGCAFDSKGSRLGQGKGYYDRFISRVRVSTDDNDDSKEGKKTKPLLVAVSLEPQYLGDNVVPTLDHDFSMDIVLTPQNAIIV